MATPYVVQKIPLTKTSNEFDHCNGENGSITSCTANVPNGSCRISSAPWCPMCERGAADVHHDTLTKSLVDGFRKVDSGIHDSFKNLQPVVNKLNTQVISENISQKLSNLTQKAGIFVSPLKESQTARPSENGVHEKYVREVEVLKGKIQELRENLQRQFSESDGIISSIPKIIWNKSELPEPHAASNDEQDESQAVNSAECKRTRKISELDKSDSIVGQKRPRDISPELVGVSSGLKQSESDLLSQDRLSPGPSPVKLKELSLSQGSSSSPESNKPDFSAISLNGSSSVTSSLKCTQRRSSIHPALRPSLFPNVPPFIRFVSHDCQVKEPLPAAVCKILRWQITTITPLVVRKTVINSGFKLVKHSPDWTGTWGKHMKSVMFKTIRENQKINHFPGTFQIGRKDKLWKNLHHLMIVFSRREFGFIPRTYILPQDLKMLRIAWEKDGGNESTWIIKPPASARGTGIKVVSKWAQIPKKAPLIVQKYISNPYLINGNKFDLRLYALVTSFNPLRIYLYDNGLVRFASVKYSEDINCLSDRYMHLTNYSINKFSNNYHHNEDADACQGHKWTIKTLFTYLQEKVNVKELWERLTDLVIKTTFCGEKSICNLSRSNLTSHYCSYELFGVDVLLDENLTPWLLEVNISPSLHSASPLDLAVKGPLIQDILNIAGYQIPDMLSDTLKSEVKAKLGLGEEDALCYNKDLCIAGLSPREKAKHEEFIPVDRPEYLDEILKNLTPDDIRHLIRYEDELTQIGSFEKVFPTTKSHKYLRYFESPQYYNKLFDAWETKFSKNRMLGVVNLQNLCYKGCHLDTDNVNLHVSVSVSEVAEAVNEATVVTPDASDVSLRASCGPNIVSKIIRRRKKVNFSARPYGRFNRTRLHRLRTT